MTEIGKNRKSVLEGYANFLRERELALPEHRPQLVRWVRVREEQNTYSLNFDGENAVLRAEHTYF